ncbi:MAG: winged helix-turn-helix domain-containing protein [Neisseriales bacterium]|nr:MAG: winged helix-turn-helix domain-containing protein [Neisseriales bacterium]
MQDQLIKLEPTEFRLLHFLMKHPDRLYRYTRLTDQIWDGHIFASEHTIINSELGKGADLVYDFFISQTEETNE